MRNSNLEINNIDMILINGINQCILERGCKKENPILLFLHGGPGSSEMSFYPYESRLEEEFIVVNWDQRGTCRSYNKNIPSDSFTLEQFILDTHEVVKYLLKKYNKQKIYLLGHSWGSLLGMKVIHRYPELFLGYIGVGQVANTFKSETIAYEYLCKEAKKQNDAKTIKILDALGGYPYKNNKDIMKQRKLLAKYKGAIFNPSIKVSTILKLYLTSKYNSLFDLYKMFKSLTIMNSMLPIVFETDLFKDIPEVKVPVYIFIGKHDYTTAFEVSEEYFNFLKAPKKELVWFENSAHMINIEESDKFNEEVINKLLH